jgi:hypothetical protein
MAIPLRLERMTLFEQSRVVESRRAINIALLGVKKELLKRQKLFVNPTPRFTRGLLQEALKLIGHLTLFASMHSSATARSAGVMSSFA